MKATPRKTTENRRPASRDKARGARVQQTEDFYDTLGLKPEDMEALAETLWQRLNAKRGDVESFREFEGALLEASNELCRQLIKKNSTR